MAAKPAPSLLERLEAGDLTLEKAIRSPASRSLSVEALLRACPERGKRQVQTILRKTLLRGDLQVRLITEYQLDRLLAELAGKKQPPWPQSQTPRIHT
jgi:hypothetical protein